MCFQCDVLADHQYARRSRIATTAHRQRPRCRDVQCDVLADHQYARRSRIATTAHRQRPRCRDDQVAKKRKRSKSASSSRKRKRSEVAGPPQLPSEVPRFVPKPRDPIPPEDLPAVSSMPLSLQPSRAPIQDDGPLMIHNHTVEEYQQIYHEVVDDMLRFKNGRPRPYSLNLGLQIKQKLWERLNRPSLTTTVAEDGLQTVHVSYGAGEYPPLHNVDISDEPRPPKRFTKSK
ncbi:uncharacterized protein PAE49_014030 isoform 2-T3 [Odontesthes bonariensis]|uniref:uncharacterized protein LOC142397400 isoform X2 n=1 Tax=Odontesthes bonariensis TaxID=219752 RepID=UPI003F583E52